MLSNQLDNLFQILLIRELVKLGIKMKANEMIELMPKICPHSVTHYIGLVGFGLTNNRFLHNLQIDRFTVIYLTLLPQTSTTALLTLKTPNFVKAWRFPSNPAYIFIKILKIFLKNITV